MHRLHHAVAYLAALAAPALAAAQAGAVETSPRPMARPAALAAASPATSPAINDGPERIVQAQANPGFDNWIAGFRGRALGQGISPQVFDAAFRGVRYNTDVVAKDHNQAEFKRNIWDYLDSAASPDRVRLGQQSMRQHASILNQIERAYGVEKEIVTAVWGLESYYGTRMGDIPVIEALATLAYDGRRGAFFEKQLIAALQIIQQGNVSPRDMTGSWAGAMGHTQFIPTSFLAYAVDANGDGRRDIWSGSPVDALASTAAYLKRFGWTYGQPWGVEVQLPAGFNTGLAGRGTKRSPSDWAAMGVRDMRGGRVPDFGAASILLPAGPQGAAFMVFRNFDVITRYNNAEAYVIGVGHLADRLAGGPPIQGGWPRGYTPVSFEERKDIQRLLTRKGFLDDKIDGIIGPNTVNAIRAFQASRGVAADGNPSREVLEMLRR